MPAIYCFTCGWPDAVLDPRTKMCAWCLEHWAADAADRLRDRDLGLHPRPIRRPP